MEQDYKGVLVYGEQKNGVIHNVTYELLAKGKELADKLDVSLMCAVLGPEGMDLQELIYRGADKVYYLSHEHLFSNPEEMVFAKNLNNLITTIKPEICLFGATTFGRSLAPRVAASVKCGMTADCIDLQIDDDSKLIQIRPAFSENILAHIKSRVKPQMATIRYKEFDEAKQDTNRKGEIINFDTVEIENPQVKVVEKLVTEDFDITNAEVVISVGKGIKNPEDLGIFEELAKSLHGVMGASRPIVEEGFFPRAHQIGYSGNRVKAKLYIACGISGAAQHLAGMKESDMIIAINSDPSAPIFKVADFGIVGDMYKIVPELTNKIKNN